MSHDDETFARELRAEVDRVAPPIAISTDEVLPRARRVRARRVAVTGVASFGVMALTAGWVAMAHPFDPTPVEVLPAAPTSSAAPVEPTGLATVDARAVLDAKSGTITTPIDEWTRSAEDDAVERTAVTHYLVGCLQEVGYEAEFLGPLLPAGPGRDAVAYGLWRMADARSTGYESVLAIPEATTAGTGAQWDRDVVPQDVSQGCYQDAQEAGLSYDPLDFEVGTHPEAPETGYPDALSTEAGRLIRAAWRECLVDQGVSVPSSAEAGMVPHGVLGLPLDEQIRIATLDVDCKQQLGTVQQLADLDAAAQEEYVEANRSYLAGRHAVEEEVLATAREYLDEHDVEMP